LGLRGEKKRGEKDGGAKEGKTRALLYLNVFSFPSGDERGRKRQRGKMEVTALGTRSVSQPKEKKTRERGGKDDTSADDGGKTEPLILAGGKQREYEVPMVLSAP